MEEKITALAEELHEEMLSFFSKRGRTSGFAEGHYQKLYDALNAFQAVERYRPALMESEKAVV